ncbi:MAG TPA: hypothetical protein VFY80_03300 [Burkholderiales bacterium]|nr:hypothetical protein [Burkholderiales bacterium]
MRINTTGYLEALESGSASGSSHQKHNRPLGHRQFPPFGAWRATWWFRGNVSLPGHPSYPGAGDDLRIRTLNREAGLRIDAHTSRCRWQGETMDYSMAIEGMYGLEEHAARASSAQPA